MTFCRENRTAVILLSETEYLYTFQKGFNYSEDGPGNRLVYHLSGCNLRCPWCSNPEGLTIGESAVKYTAEELISEVLDCKMMFFGGGGVTFTGGECACQREVLLNIIEALKKEGVHTCIETNASLEGCEKLYSSVDYMIADYKSANEEVLLSVTGAKKSTVFKNILMRAETGLPLLVRIPLIKGFNTGEENARLLSRDLKAVNTAAPKSNVSVEILRYHEFGREKWEKLGLTYSMKDAFVNDGDVSVLKTELIKAGLTLVST